MRTTMPRATTLALSTPVISRGITSISSTSAFSGSGSLAWNSAPVWLTLSTVPGCQASVPTSRYFIS